MYRRESEGRYIGKPVGATHHVEMEAQSIAMNVPNLDAMTAEELDEFSGHASTLAQYANMKLMAMKNRIDGHTDDAVRIEAHCEHLYQLLPNEWRW
jgi:hypothetical protein